MTAIENPQVGDLAEFKYSPPIGTGLRGKRVGMVVFSSYPADPRPRRAAEALVKEGMHLELLCEGDEKMPSRETVSGMEITRIPIRHHRGGKFSYACQYSGFILMAASILAWRSLRRSYDLIYIHNMPDVLVFSALVPKMLGAKVILDQHDPMPELMKTIFNFGDDSFAVRMMRRLEKWSLGFADLVITVNVACKRIFAARSCCAEKVGIVMNSPDGEIFPYRSARSYPVFEPSCDKPFTIMYHGSLVERNGLDLAVEALARVHETIANAQLKVCGRSTPFLEEVMKRGRAAGIDHCIHYLGPKRLEELVGEIESCNVGVIPNQRNAFTDINTPTRIFEYLTLGKPVIAPRTPGIQDYFNPGSLLFFDAGDADELAERIKFVYFNSADSQKTAERGQHIYLAHTWQQERATLVGLVSGLLKGEHRMSQTATMPATNVAMTERDPKAISVHKVERALANVQQWVEGHDYCGYEPFDGLSSWARPLAFGNEFCERLLMQLIRQSPVNLRPIMGVRPKDSTKGQGYMAHGYLILYRVTHKSLYLEKARRCLEWLDTHKVPRFQHHSWSNHFDFVSRGGGYTKDDPIIVWTALIGHAYLEAFEITREEWFLRIAESACNWILGLPRERTGSGDCISYLFDVQSSIHNANMLGASLLARTAKFNGNQEYHRLARSGMEYSCSRQLADGSWWYAEAPKYHWIDNFHTGYNLDSLDNYIQSSGDEEFRPNLERGLAFYKSHFFEENGCPKYYHTRMYPVDIQCVAQSIDTLARFSECDAECLELSAKVAAWAIGNMQDSKGYFYYRKYPIMKAKTPMLHWGQATMFKALAHLFLRLESTDSPL